MIGATVSPKPIFIIGAPRSGTSVTTWALGQHPNIQPMPETAWIVDMAISSFQAWTKGSERGRFSHLSNVEYPVEPFMARMGEGVHGAVCDVFEERCRRFYGDWRAKGVIRWNPENPNAVMQLRRSVDDRKARWVDGTPMNTPYAWGLRLLFPEARFIHLLRRPEDVAASLMKFENVGAANQEASEGLKTWIDHTHFAVLAQQAFGQEAVITIEYSELISQTPAVLARVLNFLGEDFHDDCLLPYGKRINSSDIDSRKVELLNSVKSQALFKDASALFDRALEIDLADEVRDQAGSDLKSFFLEKSRQ